MGVYWSILIESLCIKEDWDGWHNWNTNHNSCRNFCRNQETLWKKKKNTGFTCTNIKIQMIPLPPPRNVGCTFRIWDHKSFVFKKIKLESKNSPIKGIMRASSGKIIVTKFCSSVLDTIFIHFERLLCPSLCRDTRPLGSCCISFKILFPYLAYILLDISCIYFVYVAPRKIFSHPWWCLWAAKAWIPFLFYFLTV